MALPLTKRQREILDYLGEFIQQHGYAPSLEEIGRRFNLSSLATVHKHLTNLQEKGLIRRAWNRSRSGVPAATGWWRRSSGRARVKPPPDFPLFSDGFPYQHVHIERLSPTMW